MKIFVPATDGSGVTKTYSVSITGQVVAPTDVKATGIIIAGTNTISTKSGTTQLSVTVAPDNTTDK